MDPLEVASEHSNSTNFRLENAIDFIVENDVNLVNSQSVAEATQSDGNTELYVERELKRRFERKNRILEKAIVEVRQDSEGLRQALMAALDRLVFLLLILSPLLTFHTKFKCTGNVFVEFRARNGSSAKIGGQLVAG